MKSLKYLNPFIAVIIFITLACKKEVNNVSNTNIVIKDDSDKNIIKMDSMLSEKHKASLGEIIEKLPTKEKLVALTFDACEYKKPSYFDTTILNFLVREKIPITIFVSGKFALRNSAELKKISQYDFVEIENHSLNHFNHTELLNEEEIRKEVLENEEVLKEITGKKTMFFRFPGGNYNQKALSLLKNLNYPVVHWTFVSGDYDKHISPQRLYNRVIRNIQPGSILIFHINGRGYGTAEALPYIVNYLKENNYKFTKLEDIFE